MAKNKNQFIFRITVFVAVLFAVFFQISLSGKAQVQTTNPSIRQIDISAYVLGKDDLELQNGQYSVRFNIYSTDRTVTDPYPSNSDAALWSEVQTIEIRDGVLNAYLGAVVPLPEGLNFNSGSFYLGIRIGTDSEMVPRKKIGAIPLAINALSLEGSVLGTAQGNIPQLGKGGKIDLKMMPAITTLGTVDAGTWEADPITNSFIANALSGKTYNGLTLTSNADGFSVAGGSVSRTLTLLGGNVTLSGAGAAGTVMYSDGEKYSFTSQGSNGQVLLSSGSGAPTWGTVTGGSGGIITADSLDFSEFSDNLTLDANTTINTNGHNFNVNGTLEATSLIISGEATIGILGVNLTSNTSIIPSTAGLNLGSSSNHWANLYVDNLSAGGVDVSGTSSEYFTVNTDSSADENMGLRFYRSALNGYASLVWDASALQFELFKRENTGTLGDLSLNNLYANGNVGIGTTNPTYGLQVTGTLGVGGTAYFAGNVGIGTTAPAETLDVIGTGRFSGTLTAGSLNVTDGSILSIKTETSTTSGAGTPPLESRHYAYVIYDGLQNIGTDYNLGANRYVATKFTTPDETGILAQDCRFRVKASAPLTNRTDSLFVSLYTDASGKPGSMLGSGSVRELKYGIIGANYADNDFPMAFFDAFDQPITLSSNTTYWIVFNLLNSTAGGSLIFDSNVSAGAGAVKAAYGDAWTTTNVQLAVSIRQFGGYAQEFKSDNNAGGISWNGSGDGFRAEAGTGKGFNGISNSGVGVEGTSNYHIGVKGYSAFRYGGYFETYYSGGIGLYADGGGEGTALYAKSNGGPVAVFEGPRYAANDAGSANTLSIKRSPVLFPGQSLVGTVLDLENNVTNFGGTYSGSLIKGTVDTSLVLDFNPRVIDGGTAVAYMIDTKSNLANSTARLLAVRNAGSEKLSVMASGNVGIGTTNPGYNLQVAGTLGIGGTAYFAGNVGIGTTAPTAKLEIVGNGSSDLGILLKKGSVDTGVEIRGENNSMGLRTNTLERVRISFNGNIGIGTSSPISLLDVNGTSWLRGAVGGTSGLYVNSSGNVGIGTTAPGSLLTVNGVISASLGSVTSPSYVFGTDTNTGFWSSGSDTLNFSTNATERMRISSIGNIGIGTTNPLAKFEINQTAATTALAINANNQNLNSATLNIIGIESNLNRDFGKAFAIAQSGENYSRGVFYGDGAYALGSGVAERDVFISRSAANTLRISSDGSNGAANLIVNGSVGIGTTAPLASLDVFSANYPVIRGVRTTTATTGVRSADALQSLTTGNMVDGYGVVMGFEIRDNAGVDNYIADFGAARDGADNSGALVFRTYSSGTGSEKMRVNSTGNVGIGTTNPIFNLHISGSGTVAQRIESTTSSSGRAVQQFYVGSKYWDFGQNNDASNVGSFIIREDGTSRMTILAGGNVGIGTTAPGSLLTVNGVVSASLGSVSAPSYVFGTDTNTGLWSSGADTLNFSTNGAERMRIGSTGNVGIGTTNPLALFSVGSDSSFQVTSSGMIGLGGTTPLFSLGVDATDSNKFKIYSGSSITGTSEFTIDSNGLTSISNLELGSMNFADNSGQISWVDMGVNGTAPDNTIESYTAQLDGNPMFTIFGLSDGAGGVDNLKVLFPNGNVGIGTTNPGNTLSVVGSICANSTGAACAGTAPGYIYATGFIAGGTALNVPDYVFEENYNLMPLDQLATYIQTNKHLPGVPSADDIEAAGGLNLGQMVPAILEKTEENTLYILGLNLKTDNNITTLGELKTSVDEQFAKISNSELLISNQIQSTNDKIDETNKILKQVQSDNTSQDNLIAILQTQILELQNKLNTETNLAQIDLNTQDMTFVKLLLGVDRVKNPEDVDILGKLSSKTLSTGGIEITLIDPEAPTIGTALLKMGDKTVAVLTKAVNSKSKIFVAPKSTVAIQYPLTVTKINDGASFEVSVFDVLGNDAEFDWWIVESN
jgi:hypothetical protein